MRRRQLSRIGFSTGSPFPLTSHQPYDRHQHVLNGRANSHGSSNIRTSTASQSPSPSRSPSISASSSRSNSVSGQLDRGRLMAARETYEQTRRATAAAAAATSGSRTNLLNRPQSMPESRRPSTTSTAADSTSQPVSRHTSAVASSTPTKRSRENIKIEDDEGNDNDESDVSDTEESHVKSESTGRKRRKLTVKPESAVLSDDFPPPLETVTGSPFRRTNSTEASTIASTYDGSYSSAAAAATSSTITSISQVESLQVPLSAITSQSNSASTTSAVAAPPPPVDLRQKTREMFDQVLRETNVAHPLRETVKKEVKQEESKEATNHDQSTLISTLSTSIESALLFTRSGKLDATYRQRVRSLIFNLRRNANLVHRLLSKDLTPYELVQMTDDELATAETQEQRELTRQANLTASIAKSAARMPTRDFKCESCGSDDCSTRVIREERDISKADTWGSKQGAGSVIEIQCETCKHSWTKEE